MDALPKERKFTAKRYGTFIFVLLAVASLSFVYQTPDDEEIYAPIQSRVLRSVPESPLDHAPFQYRSFLHGIPFEDDRKCDSCALVFPSGSLKGSGLGKDIEAHECVIRPNDAVVRSYEADVGRRTTYRITRYRGLRVMMAHPAEYFAHEAQLRAVFVMLDWRSKGQTGSKPAARRRRSLSSVFPVKRAAKTSRVKSMASTTSAPLTFTSPLRSVLFPNVSLSSSGNASDTNATAVDIKTLPYTLRKALKHRMTQGIHFYNFTDASRMSDLYFVVTGQRPQKTLLSMGWYAFLFAHQRCHRISIYGNADPKFCEDGKNSQVPYQYYKPDGLKICDHLLGRQNTTTRKHDFFREKKVMRVIGRHGDVPIRFLTSKNLL